ncbi:peptidylprolyl isomerase [Candidatus Woesearchaeota archaeon]|nr:peptidylprolyl isomerase [Candidatus Woesearchaeota archaeon]
MENAEKKQAEDAQAESIKENDFIEIEYTGKVKDEDIVFDTTDKETAEKYGIARQGMVFGPIIVCIGEGQILKGLDKLLVGKPLGRYKVNLMPEDGFGKKSASLIQLVSTKKFTKENIQPMPGLQVEIDGMPGTIKTVTGGRTLVDFNHPLASKELVYSVNVKRILKDPKEKAESYLKIVMLMKGASTSLSDRTLKVNLKKSLPTEVEARLSEKICKLVPEIRKVSFEEEAKEAEAKGKEGAKETGKETESTEKGQEKVTNQ